jgi:hypothetical protein
MSLTETQIRRYARQLVMKEFTGAAQERLLKSRVLVYGSGPSMELCVLYLAAAGVGAVHVSAQDQTGHNLVWRAAALNPECVATVGAHGIRPDYAIDLLQDAGPTNTRQIAGALRAGIPYCRAICAAGVTIVKRYSLGDPCPGCLLNAAGFGQMDLIGAADTGVAGPATAAAAITDLIGAGPAARTAVMMDVLRGSYTDLDLTPFPGCLLCAELRAERPA